MRLPSARQPGRMIGDRRDDRRFADELIAFLPRLRRCAIVMAGSAALADDLVQDCLERAWRNRGTLHDEQVPFEWLRRILYNVHIDWRRRRRHDRSSVDVDDLVDDLALSTAPDPSRTADLARALQGLSVDHREILMLASIEGLSYQEIAEELSIAIGTVMSRLARARTALRQLLEAGPVPAPTGGAGRGLRH